MFDLQQRSGYPHRSFLQGAAKDQPTIDFQLSVCIAKVSPDARIAAFVAIAGVGYLYRRLSQYVWAKSVTGRLHYGAYSS